MLFPRSCGTSRSSGRRGNELGILQFPRWLHFEESGDSTSAGAMVPGYESRHFAIRGSGEPRQIGG